MRWTYAGEALGDYTILIYFSVQGYCSFAIDDHRLFKAKQSSQCPWYSDVISPTPSTCCVFLCLFKTQPSSSLSLHVLSHLHSFLEPPKISIVFKQGV